MKIEKKFNFFICFQIEKEVSIKLNQEPVIAPTVHAIRSNENKTESTQIYILNSSNNNSDNSRKENVKYLFENIDKSSLKADEDFIKRIYK